MSSVVALGYNNMAKVRRIIELHDEAFRHYQDNGGDGWKSSEGVVTLRSGSVFDRMDGDDDWRVEVYSYLFGPHRNHYFDSVDAALAAVTEWHQTEMANEHKDPWEGF